MRLVLHRSMEAEKTKKRRWPSFRSSGEADGRQEKNQDAKLGEEEVKGMFVRLSQDEDRGARNQPHTISGFKHRSVVLGACLVRAWRLGGPASSKGEAEAEHDPWTRGRS